MAALQCHRGYAAWRRRYRDGDKSISQQSKPTRPTTPPITSAQPKPSIGMSSSSGGQNTLSTQSSATLIIIVTPATVQWVLVGVAIAIRLSVRSYWGTLRWSVGPTLLKTKEGPSHSATAAPLYIRHGGWLGPSLQSPLCNEPYSCADNLGLAIPRQKFACSRQAISCCCINCGNDRIGHLRRHL